MIITRLSVENFAGIRDVDLDCRRVTVFAGENGAGKTSLLHAIQMALFGRCYDYEGKTIQLNDIVRQIGAWPSVRLELEHDGKSAVVDWRLTGEGTALDIIVDCEALPLNQDELRARLWREFGLDADRVDTAAFCADRLRNLDTLFKDVINKEEVFIAAAAYEERLRHFVYDCGIDIKDVASLDYLGKRFEDTRREVGRRVKSLKAQVDAAASLPLPQLPDGTTARRENDIDEYEKKINAEYEANVEQLKKAESCAMLPRYRTEIEHVQRELESITIADTEYDARLRDGLQEQLAAAEIEIKILEMGKGISGKVCPVCLKPFEGKEAKDAKKRAAEHIQLNKQKVDNLRRDIKQLNAKILEQAEARDKADILLRRRDMLRESLDAAGYIGDPVSPEKYDALREHQKELHSVLTSDIPRIRYEYKAVLESASRKKDLASAENDYQFLDWGCKTFRGALQSDMMRPKIEAFIADCNEALCGVGVELTLNDKMPPEVLVRHDDEKVSVIPYKLLSTGERCYVSAVAAMNLCDGGLVLVDGLDNLSDVRRKLLMKLISNSRCGFVLCIAKSDAEPKARQDSVLYAIQDGAALVCGGATA